MAVVRGTAEEIRGYTGQVGLRELARREDVQHKPSLQVRGGGTGERERGREKGREGRRKGEREKGREGERERGRERERERERDSRTKEGETMERERKVNVIFGKVKKQRGRNDEMLITKAPPKIYL